MPRKKAARKRSAPRVVASPDAGRRRLRTRARQRLRKQSPDNSEWAGSDVRKLAHELQVHQVELEMQNGELHRVQLELEASRDRFAELYDFAPVAYLTLEADGVIHQANLTAAAQLGVVRQDLISKKLSQFIHHESQDVFYLHQQRVFANRRKQACELQLRRPDGALFPVALESIFSEGGESKPRRSLAVFQDITERKQAETEVRQSEERHRALVEATATVVWRTTPDGNVVFATDAWSRITGQTKAQNVGWGWLDAIHPDDRAPTTQKWLHSLETRTLHENEFRVRTRGGDYRWFQVRGVPVFNADGSVREWVGTNTDIHEQKAAEAALKLSASQMDAALESTADGLLVVDTAGHITHFNRRFVEFWRLPAALLAEHDDKGMLKFVLNQLAQPREFLAKVRELYREPAADSFDVIRFKDGRIFERYSRPQWLDERPVGRVWSFRDVTAHHQTEAALRESEERLMLALASAHLGTWDWNLATGEVLWTPQHEVLFGYPPGQPRRSYRDFADRVHPEDLQNVEKIIEASNKNKTDFAAEFRVVWPDGSVHWISGYGRFYYNARSRAVRMLGTIVEVTARKQVEQALHEAHVLLEKRVEERTAQLEAANETLRDSEQRFSQLVENIEEVFWMTDVAKQKMFFVSAAYEKIWGQSRESLYAAPQNWLKGVHRADRARIRQAALTKEAGGDYDEVYRVIRPDGTERWIHDRAFPIRDASGDVYRIAGIAQDITERKRTEEALRRSGQELTDFFEQSPTGLLWVKPDGRIVKLNRAQQKLFGCRAPEVLGHKVTEFFPEAGHVTGPVAKGETVLAQRTQFRQKNGTLKHVLIDANGLWANGRLVHSRWFVRDITRRVELEREILNISEREQLRMSQDLHDDLGQQLTGIQFLTDTLAGELAEKSKADRAREIAGLVRNAMTQTRELARGLFPVSMETAGLADALKLLAARITRVFRRECRFRCPAPVLVADHAMGTHLYRIAQEAVSNAIRHGKARRIDIALTRQENQLVLKVSDQGVGLPRKPKNQKGMGLRIMQYRAGVIGGVLLVQRRPAGGTEVVCTIPDGQLSKHAPTTK